MMWIIWFTLACVFIGIEFYTVSFLTVYLAFGAILAGLLSVLVRNILVQVCVFLATSLLFYYMGNRMLQKYILMIHPRVRAAAAESMLEHTGVVTKTISPRHHGTVKIHYAIWNARSVKNLILKSGCRIKVIGNEGPVLIVVPDDY